MAFVENDMDSECVCVCVWGDGLKKSKTWAFMENGMDLRDIRWR